MPNVLVTGGTGFVGSWMRKTQPEGIGASYWSKYDYEASWLSLAHNFRYIIHLANIPPARVIALAKGYNARLLYCSSGATYDQRTEYADNKRRWEQECLSSGVDCVIARLFTFYGEGLDDGKAITQFVKAAKAGQPIEIWGDGSTVRSYMSGRDMGRLLWAILLRGKSGEVYDVGSTKPVTMLQLAQAVSKRFGPVPIHIQGGKDPAPYYVPQNMEKTWALVK